MRVMHLSSGFNTNGVTAGLICLAQHGFYNNFDDFRIVGTERGDPKIFDRFRKIVEPGQIAFLEYDRSISSSRFSQTLWGIRQQIDDFCPNAIILSTSGRVIEGRLVARHYSELKIGTFEHGTLSNIPEKKKRTLRRTSSANHFILGDAPGTIEITKRTLYAPGTTDVPSYVIPLSIPEFGPPRIPQNVNELEVVSLGRLDPEKNYFELVHAVAILIGKRYRFHLTIAGNGKYFKELKQLAEDLSISDHVTLPGFVDDKYALLSKSQIYIQPSLTEGLGLGFIEAAAQGLVVVGTDVGGMKDYGIDNHNMIKIKGFDRYAIATGLQRAIDDYSSIASEFSKRAISMVSRYFNAEAVKQEWKVASDGVKALCTPVKLEKNLQTTIQSDFAFSPSA